MSYTGGFDPLLRARPQNSNATIDTSFAVRKQVSKTSGSAAVAAGPTTGSTTAKKHNYPRTIQWRIDLHLLPPPKPHHASLSQLLTDNSALLDKQRNRYDSLMQKHLWECSPLALIEENSTQADKSLKKCEMGADPLSAMMMEDEEAKRRERKERNQQKRANKAWERELLASGILQLVNRPVEEEDNSPSGKTSKWSLFHMSRETLSLIEKDLNRLPPHHFTVTSRPVIPLTTTRRNDRTQLLSQILFVYAKEYPVLGYRQGMHEIASFILLALELDHESETPGWIWDATYIAHDAFVIFELIMFHLSPAYDPMADEIPPPPHVLNTTRPRDINMSTIVQGVFQKIKVSNVKLYTFLNDNVAVPPQLYCTRWIRLMFCREINSVSLALISWDYMFDYFTKGVAFMDILEYVAAAMILLIGNNIMKGGEENDAIHILMNYPQLDDIAPLFDKVQNLMRNSGKLKSVSSRRHKTESATAGPTTTTTNAIPAKNARPKESATSPKATNPNAPRPPSNTSTQSHSLNRGVSPFQGGFHLQQSVKTVTTQWSKWSENIGASIAEAVTHPPRHNRDVEEKLSKSVKVMVEYLKGFEEKGVSVPDDVWEAVHVFENVRKVVAGGDRNGGEVIA